MADLRRVLERRLRESLAEYWPSVYDCAVLVKVLAEGAVVLESDIGVQRIWTAARLRKENHCARCRSTCAKGTEAYRPLTFSNDRHNRLCPPCIDEIRAGKVRSRERSGT